MLVCGLALLISLGGLVTDASFGQPRAAAGGPAPAVQFIANVGQFDSRARFLAQLSGATVFLADDAIWLTAPASGATPARDPSIGGVGLRLSFAGAHSRPRIEPFERQPTRVAYFIGDRPSGWYADVPAWGGVRYRELYPRIDLELAGEAGHLAMRLVAHPGADLSAVRMRVEGADQVAVADDRMLLASAIGPVSLPLLRVVDEKGQRLAAPAPAVAGAIVAAPFAAGQASGGLALAGAADLAYSTFYGTSSDDEGDSLTLGPDGAAYIGGWTSSGSFPTTPGAYKNAPNSGINATVVKLNAQANAPPAYVAVIGGGDVDYISGIAVDQFGAAYAVGYTSSTNFPTTPGSFDTSGAGVDKTNRDVFVFKLNPQGSGLDYSTYFGGSGDERGFEIAVDDSGAAYFTGRTLSNNFPATPGAYDTSYNGGFDAYVVKLKPDGSGREYATFLGGGPNDQGNDIFVDPNDGSAYVTGYTQSLDFPTPGGYDTGFNGLDDAFVVKLSPSGADLLYGTFLGGTQADRGEGIDVDATGAIYITGSTESGDFPATPAAYDTSYNDLKDAYVAKLSPSGTELIYATYLGGSAADGGTAIAVNASGEAHVSGYTLSSDFPLSANPYDGSYNKGSDGFAAKLRADGATPLTYATYLGGSGDDSADGIALDESSAIYLSGFTASGNFPFTTGAANTSYGGGHDIFLTKLSIDTVPLYEISGVVRSQNGTPIPDVTVTATPGSYTAITGADGVYRLRALPANTYKLTAARAGYTFQPAEISVTITNASVGGQNFTAPILTYTIGGRVIDSDTLAGVRDVRIAVSNGGTATTDGNGDFRIPSLPAGQYVLTPKLTGYRFDPPSRTPTIAASDIGAQNFVAVRLPPSYVHLPLALYSPPPSCDPYEPNNSASSARRLISGQAVLAKLCQGDSEDNYTFATTTGSFQVALALPPRYVNHMILFVYDDPSSSEPICGAGPVTQANYSPACPNRGPGQYYVRLYLDDDRLAGDADTYTLRVTYQ